MRRKRASTPFASARRKCVEERMRSIGKRGIKKLVVFSMDVCKMFPSMVAADVARVVREEYKSARLEVEVDDNELRLALAWEGWLFKNP